MAVAAQITFSIVISGVEVASSVGALPGAANDRASWIVVPESWQPRRWHAACAGQSGRSFVFANYYGR